MNNHKHLIDPACDYDPNCGYCEGNGFYICGECQNDPDHVKDCGWCNGEGYVGCDQCWTPKGDGQFDRIRTATKMFDRGEISRKDMDSLIDAAADPVAFEITLAAITTSPGAYK